MASMEKDVPNLMEVLAVTPAVKHMCCCCRHSGSWALVAVVTLVTLGIDSLQHWVL